MSPDLVRAELQPRRRSIGGMTVDVVSMPDAARTVGGWTSAQPARLVVTPNTDHFLRWTKDRDFAALYRRADLVTLDSAILQLLAAVEGGAVPDRVTGADLLVAGAEQAAAAGAPLVIVGGAPGVAAAAADHLCESFPDLRVAFTLAPTTAELADPVWRRELIDRLDLLPAKLVALCLGSPKQERLFAELVEESPELTGVFLCAGAAVDFAAGSVRRAPRAVQRAGLEWAYRLLQEPRRLWRRYLVEDVRILRYFAAAAVGRVLGRRRWQPETGWFHSGA